MATPTTKQAGADAAGDQQVADAFRQLIDNDPEIQAVIQRVWGNTSRDQRPSDTPGHLENANAQASKEIAAILQRKGINLPDRTFINPRSGALEGHRGWSGLSGLQKAIIIAAAAAATGGAGLALAGGGAAAGGAAGAAGAAGAGGGTAGTIAGLGAGLGVSAGVPAGLGAATATGIGAGGASLAGGLGAGAAGAAGAAGSGAAAGGGGFMASLPTYAKYAQAAGSILGGAAGSAADSRAQQNNAELNRAILAQQMQNNVGQLDLQRKNFEEQARGSRSRQAVIADLLSNAKPSNVSVPGIQNAQVSGGFGPSSIGATGRQSLAELAKQALAAQMTPTQFKGGDLVPIPEAHKAGAGEKFLNAAALGASLYGGMFAGR